MRPFSIHHLKIDVNWPVKWPLIVQKSTSIVFRFSQSSCFNFNLELPWNFKLLQGKLTESFSRKSKYPFDSVSAPVSCVGRTDSGFWFRPTRSPAKLGNGNINVITINLSMRLKSQENWNSSRFRAESRIQTNLRYLSVFLHPQPNLICDMNVNVNAKCQPLSSLCNFLPIQWTFFFFLSQPDLFNTHFPVFYTFKLLGGINPEIDERESWGSDDASKAVIRIRAN